MKSKVSILLSALCCLYIPAIHAGDANVFRDEARVVRVDPILETVNLPVTRQICEHIEVGKQAPAAAIGEDIRRSERQHRRSCRFVEEMHYQERVTSYRVTYRYAGHTVTSRLPYDPGESMPVNVSLIPKN